MATNSKYWLGSPVGRLGMTVLPSVSAGATVPMSRAEQIHGLLGGGTTTLRAPLIKRQWQLSREWLNQDEQEILRMFYSGAVDPGPFRFLDPGERNYLSGSASTFNRIDDGSAGLWWSLNAGTGTFAISDTDTDYPTLPQLLQSSVGYFGGAITTSILTANATLLDVDKTPRLPGCDYVFSVWAKLGSGTSISLQAGLISGSTVVGTAVALSTSWQQIIVVASAAALGTMTPYITPQIKVTAVAGSGIGKLVGPQLEIATAANPYNLGLGVATVGFAPDSSGAGGLSSSVPRTRYRSPSWTLAEI